jgi:hypothetical protein
LLTTRFFQGIVSPPSGRAHPSFNLANGFTITSVFFGMMHPSSIPFVFFCPRAGRKWG